MRAPAAVPLPHQGRALRGMLSVVAYGPIAASTPLFP